MRGVRYDEAISPDSRFPEWIHTERLHLTPLYQTRASTLYDLFDDTQSKTFRYTPFDAIETIADAFDLLEHATRSWNKHQDAFYLIRQRVDDAAVGIAGLTNVDWERRRLETGIVLHPSYWGNGYATERLLASYEVAFVLYDFAYVVSLVQPANNASRAAVEKAIDEVGGEQWGVLPNELVSGGASADAIQYVVSKKQYDIYAGDRRSSKD